MSLQNLKSIYNKIFKKTLPANDKYIPEVAKVEIDGIPIEGVKEAIDKIQSMFTKLEELTLLIPVLQENNNKAFQEGIEQGMKMKLQDEEFIQVLVSTRELLLESIFTTSVNEHTVEKFIEWYENTRNPSVNPHTDIRTYKTCLSISKITSVLQDHFESKVE